MIDLIQRTSLSLSMSALITLFIVGVTIACGDLESDEWTTRSDDALDQSSQPEAGSEVSSDSELDATPSKLEPIDSISCEDAPLVTWSTFGQGFVTTYCQGCHAREAPNRYGAPESISFDTLDEVLPHRQRLLTIIAGEEATMPPGGGVNTLDLNRLIIWLTCIEEVTL